MGTMLFEELGKPIENRVLSNADPSNRGRSTKRKPSCALQHEHRMKQSAAGPPWATHHDICTGNTPAATTRVGPVMRWVNPKFSQKPTCR